MYTHIHEFGTRIELKCCRLNFSDARILFSISALSPYAFCVLFHVLLHSRIRMFISNVYTYALNVYFSIILNRVDQINNFALTTEEFSA